MPFEWSALAGPAVDLLTGGLSFLGSTSNNASNLGYAQARDAQSLQLAREQFDFQKQMAQQGIQWRVADAKAAGIHPLAAMGGSTSFSPSTFMPGDIPQSENAFAGFRGLGQDLSKAIASMQTKEDKHDSVVKALQVRRLELENDLLSAQIGKTQMSMMPPAPSVSTVDRYGNPRSTIEASQGNWDPPIGTVPSGELGGYKPSPPELVTAAPGRDTNVGGYAAPSVQFRRSGSGLQAFPPEKMGVEDEFAAPLMTDWWIRNRVLPNFVRSRDSAMAPTMSQVREHFPGATGVYFDSSQQVWVPMYGGNRGLRDRYIDWRNRALGLEK